MKPIADDLIAGLFILIVFLGFIDWLWIFGIESSRSYTWWALMPVMHEYVNNFIGG